MNNISCKSNEIKPTFRDNSIDATKGILILMVVYSHCFTEGFLHNFFFAFHMPAFFSISGINASLSHEESRPFGKTFMLLINSLGVPFVFFEILGILQEVLRNGFSQSWRGFLFNSLTLRCNNIVDWFLGSLLFAKMLSILSRKLLSKLLNRKTADIVYLIICISIMVAAVLFPHTEPYMFVVIRRILIAHGFLAIGLTLEPIIRKRSLILGIVALAVSFLLSLLNPEYVDINELHFGIYVIFFSAAILGSYGILQIGKLACIFPFLWLGKNSLIIMGTHIPILLLFRSAFRITAPTIEDRLIVFLLILALEIPIIWFIRRFAPFLIGKTKSQKHETNCISDNNH